MTIIKLTILAATLASLAGCVVPLGKSTGPDDNRSPYLSNEGDRDPAPQSSQELREDAPADKMN